MAKRAGLGGTFWPSAEQELLLRAALLDEEPSREAWATLRPELDVERLEIGSMALLPLLYVRLTDRGATEHFLPRLKGVYRYTWYRNQVAQQSLASVLGTLEGRGIETIVIQEAALVLAYYRRLGVRQLEEPAVLVRSSSRDDALGALAGAGWERTPAGSGGHRAVAREKAGVSLRSALFWRALLELESGEEAEAQLWRSRRETEVEGVATSVLSPTHALLHTCVDGARNRGGIMWVADAYSILGAASADVDWSELVDEARRIHCALRVRDALAYLAEALDAPVPRGVREELASTPTGGRERLAHRIGGRGGRLFGNLPVTVAVHLVATEDRGLLKTAATLPGFLRAEWGLDHLGQLPAAAIRKGASAVSEARAAGRHEPG
jgi:Uncharacterised nucleotidyltransferase